MYPRLQPYVLEAVTICVTICVLPYVYYPYVYYHMCSMGVLRIERHRHGQRAERGECSVGRRAAEQRAVRRVVRRRHGLAAVTEAAEA